MLRLLLLCAAFYNQQALGLIDVSHRIVGGVNADISEAPYQVAILLHYPPEEPSLTCGGSILRPDTVITAAHCAKLNIKDYLIRAGSSNNSDGGQLSLVRHILWHEKNNLETEYDYDVALFFLKTPFHLNSQTLAAIELPQQDEPVKDGTYALVTGWGSMRPTARSGELPNQLQKVLVPIINQQACVNVYANQSITITPRMLCAGFLKTGGKDSCQGDSGGPMVVDDKLVGLVSFGIGCAMPNDPGVYTRVAAVRNWIDKKISENVLNSTQSSE